MAIFTFLGISVSRSSCVVPPYSFQAWSAAKLPAAAPAAACHLRTTKDAG